MSQPLGNDMTLRSLKELFQGKSSLGEGENNIDLGAAHMNQSDWVCAWSDPFQGCEFSYYFPLWASVSPSIKRGPLRNL